MLIIKLPSDKRISYRDCKNYGGVVPLLLFRFKSFLFLSQRYRTQYRRWGKDSRLTSYLRGFLSNQNSPFVCREELLLISKITHLIHYHKHPSPSKTLPPPPPASPLFPIQFRIKVTKNKSSTLFEFIRYCSGSYNGPSRVRKRN